MAKLTWTRHAVDDAARSTTRPERVSIDLRGHRRALSVVAQSMQVPVATLASAILVEWLEAPSVGGLERAAGADAARSDDPITQVKVRMPTRHAAELARTARAAELSRGMYVARLMERLPPAPVAPDQSENRLALLRSTAELAAMSDDLQTFMRGMLQTSSPENIALEAVVAGLSTALNRHLAVAALLMASLTPSQRQLAGDPVSGHKGALT